MPMGGFFAPNQRLSNIYDGPSYQDSNAYLDITVADCPIWNNRHRARVHVRVADQHSSV